MSEDNRVRIGPVCDALREKLTPEAYGDLTLGDLRYILQFLESEASEWRHVDGTRSPRPFADQVEGAHTMLLFHKEMDRKDRR